MFLRMLVALPDGKMSAKTVEAPIGDAMPAQRSTASKIEAAWLSSSPSGGNGRGAIPTSKRGSSEKMRGASWNTFHLHANDKRRKAAIPPQRVARFSPSDTR